MSSIPFLTPSRCVLVIGDEALYVYNSTGAKTQLVNSVPWVSGDFEETVIDTIRNECGGRSLLVVNDMTDQHFKGGQRIPKVGPLDKMHVLARKLSVAFPSYPIRGALQVKDTKPQAEGAGSMYLFAAVPMSEPVAKTLNVVRRSLLSISGFVLLPVESSDMVKAFAEKAMRRNKTKSRWAVLIGQHMSGGLRQVITRDGQLAMTRMTPIADMHSDPQGWANDVVQEFKATISYLSRFGYSANDGTEVFVIATPSAGEEIRNQIDLPCNFSNYTVAEAADILGLRIGGQDDQYHADPLHIAWAARKSKFILPMDAQDIKNIYGPRQGAMIGALLLFSSAAYLAWQVMSAGPALLEIRSDLATQKQQQTTVEAEYQSELARLKELGFDIKLIQSSLNTLKALEADSIHPMPVFKAIGEALGQELRLDKLMIDRVPITYDENNPAPEDFTEIQAMMNLRAVMTLSFPQTVEPEAGVRQIDSLRSRLGALLGDGYKVTISKQVADLTYTENTSGQVGGSPEARTGEDYKAEIMIEGPLK